MSQAHTLNRDFSVQALPFQSDPLHTSRRRTGLQSRTGAWRSNCWMRGSLDIAVTSDETSHGVAPLSPASYFRASQSHRWANSLHTGLPTISKPVAPGLYLSPSFVLLIACLLCAFGCHNTCVSGTLNSPSGSTFKVIASNPPPLCTLSTANVVVHMEVGAAPRANVASAIGVAPTRIAHLFVTLAAVEARLSEVDGDDTAWQPLAELQAHPLQFDLLAEGHAPLPDAALPAGVYREIRLRFSSELGGETADEKNHCGGGAPHCAVMADGRERPLAFPFSRFDPRIALGELPGGELYVPPDGTVSLAIELDLDRSWVRSSSGSLIFYPVFRLRRAD